MISGRHNCQLEYSKLGIGLSLITFVYIILMSSDEKKKTPQSQNEHSLFEIGQGHSPTRLLAVIQCGFCGQELKIWR